VTLMIPTESYWISKYPITNAQFAKFMDAGGYSTERWWTEEGRQKRLEGWHYDGVWKPSGTPWKEPRHWTDNRFIGDDKPVVGVSWYECVAFCMWLKEETGENIMLPTEAQWQYAVQGDDGRAYPWGNEWDSTKCQHSVGNNAGKTSPVIQYEGKHKGNSPFGVVDMAGNVLEWCLTDYENRTNDVNSIANRRVLRGGSWMNNNTYYFRCDYRIRLNRLFGNNGRGFRVARLK
ncbi:MAG: SUMF1/EgtB/PvdO family nonheme iron enzyme, partial [Chloroflexota bacterium]